MKKLYAIMLIISMIFVSGCREKELISVPIFITRFNRCSPDKIGKKNIRAIEENDTLVYSFLPEDNILITLKAQKDSGQIKHCSVTARNDESLDEDIFFERCREVVMAYEKSDKNHAENVLRSFSFKKHEISSKDGFYRIDFLINDAAAFFRIESSRLNDEKVTDKKLYEQTYS